MAETGLQSEAAARYTKFLNVLTFLAKTDQLVPELPV